MEMLLQTIAIIASVIGSAYYIHRDIKSEINTQTSRLDALNSRCDAQNARTDQLYQMFIDLLKERNNRK